MKPFGKGPAHEAWGEEPPQPAPAPSLPPPARPGEYVCLQYAAMYPDRRNCDRAEGHDGEHVGTLAVRSYLPRAAFRPGHYSCVGGQWSPCRPFYPWDRRVKA